MQTNTTKAKLAAGDVVFGAIITRYAPDLVEIFGAVGYDFVMIDCEHGPDEPGPGGAHGAGRRILWHYAHRPHPQPRGVHHIAVPGPGPAGHYRTSRQFR